MRGLHGRRRDVFEQRLPVHVRDGVQPLSERDQVSRRDGLLHRLSCVGLQLPHRLPGGDGLHDPLRQQRVHRAHPVRRQRLLGDVRGQQLVPRRRHRRRQHEYDHVQRDGFV
jgi:hypothetical protein